MKKIVSIFFKRKKSRIEILTKKTKLLDMKYLVNHFEPRPNFFAFYKTRCILKLLKGGHSFVGIADYVWVGALGTLPNPQKLKNPQNLKSHKT